VLCLNRYDCPACKDWWYDCSEDIHNEECPTCGKEIEPSHSQSLSEESLNVEES